MRFLKQAIFAAVGLLTLGGAVGLGAVGSWKFLQDRENLIAEVDGTRLTFHSLKAEFKQKLQKLDEDRAALVRSAAEEWIENTLLAKEARARSKTLEDYLKEEFGPSQKVSRAAAIAVYAASPSAERLPFEKALNEIQADLQKKNFDRKKRALIERIRSRYEIQTYGIAGVEKAGQAVPATTSERFPPFSVPKARPDIKKGRVVGPPFRGPDRAPVLLEVFSDFMCPFSAKFRTALSELQASYTDTVRVEFRHFPLPLHKGADLMHEASLCAQEQGQFWAYHDALFQNLGAKNKEVLLELAHSLGIDSGSFKSCLESGRYRKRVAEEIALGKKRGVRGTPTYFFNGRLRSGAVPADRLKPLIDWLLQPKGPAPGASE